MSWYLDSCVRRVLATLSRERCTKVYKISLHISVNTRLEPIELMGTHSSENKVLYINGLEINRYSPANPIPDKGDAKSRGVAAGSSKAFESMYCMALSKL